MFNQPFYPNPTLLPIATPTHCPPTYYGNLINSHTTVQYANTECLSQILILVYIGLT